MSWITQAPHQGSSVLSAHPKIKAKQLRSALIQHSPSTPHHFSMCIDVSDRILPSVCEFVPFSRAWEIKLVDGDLTLYLLCTGVLRSSGYSLTQACPWQSTGLQCVWDTQMPQQTRQRQLGGVRQTPWRGKENFSASSKTDTATLGCKGQNKRALPMLAMNTGFRCISKYLKVSQIKAKSLACTYSTLLRLFISTAVKAFFFFFNRDAFYTAKRV